MVVVEATNKIIHSQMYYIVSLNIEYCYNTFFLSFQVSDNISSPTSVFEHLYIDRRLTPMKKHVCKNMNIFCFFFVFSKIMNSWSPES